jgi:hypothetical protein
MVAGGLGHPRSDLFDHPALHAEDTGQGMGSAGRGRQVVWQTPCHHPDQDFVATAGEFKTFQMEWP